MGVELSSGCVVVFMSRFGGDCGNGVFFTDCANAADNFRPRDCLDVGVGDLQQVCVEVVHVHEAHDAQDVRHYLPYVECGEEDEEEERESREFGDASVNDHVGEMSDLLVPKLGIVDAP